MNDSSAPPTESKRILAGVLGIVFGSLGIHKFVLGYTLEGVIMLVVTVVGFPFTCGISGYVMALIGLIEGIVYLTKTDAEFVARYQQQKHAWF
jgi:TM2 domain-containing membrane protein YozV